MYDKDEATSMKKVYLYIFLLALLILDFTALDDITTGREPNYFGEYATLIISVPLLIFLTFKLFRKKVTIKK